jgi:hypothetical protein
MSDNGLALAVFIIGLLLLLCFILFMLACRTTINVIRRRWESRPVWTDEDDEELRKLMRQ